MAQLFSLGVMCTSIDKLKKADRNLVMASIACLVVGLLLAWLSFSTYFKHYFEFLDPDKPVSVAVSRLLIKSIKLYTFVLLPVLAGGYFMVAYSIWNYRRKRVKIKKHDDVAA